MLHFHNLCLTRIQKCLKNMKEHFTFFIIIECNKNITWCYKKQWSSWSMLEIFFWVIPRNIAIVMVLGSHCLSHFVCFVYWFSFFVFSLMYFYVSLVYFSRYVFFSVKNHKVLKKRVGGYITVGLSDFLYEIFFSTRFMLMLDVCCNAVKQRCHFICNVDIDIGIMKMYC